MMHQSIATIDSPEFINLQPLEINPLMSSCEIKVLYLGENRNHSYITKEVATEMAKTLRGAPIVGYYKDEKEDFRDHGEKIIFDDEGVKFECLTKPYGFVAPDAKVWFQKFEDTDDFGNKVTREYLMTTGYLWTGQYEEAKLAIEEGRPQSMELDEETLDGRWSTNNNTGMDFFIINDAIFSKLCILGEDVEPCFEGSSITAPEVSKQFTKMDDDFKKTLFTMMQDLKHALKGGYKMELEDKNVETEVTTAIEEEVTTVEAPETEAVEEAVEEVAAVEEETISTEDTDDSIDATQPSQEEEYTAAKDDKEESEEDKDEDESAEDTDKENDSEEDEDKKEKDYSLLEQELETLKTSYAEMEAKYQELVTFKEAVDNEKKDALINSFYMLSDEDKKDVIENKSKYSLDEIEAKLSVICVRKKVNFDSEDTDKNENTVEDEVMTYNLNNEGSAIMPEWLKALKNTRDSKE